MSAKILLISPPAYGNELTMINPFPTPPLGLCVLKNELIKHGHEVEILDSAVIPFDFFSLKKFICEYQPNIIGITTYYQNINIIYIAKLIRSISKDIKIVLGGVMATKFGQLILELDYENLIDFVLIDSGINELVEIANGNTNNSSIFNKINNGYINTKKQNCIFFSGNYYLPNISPVLYKRFHYVFNNGCPFNCDFCVCAQQQKNNSFDTKSIISEINMINNYYGHKNFVFLDETLTLNKEKLMEIKHKINKDITFWGGTRTDCIDKESIKLLGELNFNKLFLGTESTKPDTQKFISHKSKNLADIKAKVDLLHGVGIKVETSLLIGLPFETKKDFENSLSDVIEIGFDYIMFTFLHIIPGTKMYQNHKDYGYQFIKQAQNLYELFNQDNFKVDGKGFVKSQYLSVEDCNMLLHETTTKLDYRSRYGKPMGYIQNNLHSFPY